MAGCALPLSAWTVLRSALFTLLAVAALAGTPFLMGLDWMLPSFFYKPKLNFKKQADGSFDFRILQITDIHLGENSWTDWGPEQDRKTWLALDSYLSYEDPDLIVLTGDQLTANNVDENATAYYDLLAHKLTSYGVPWAMIFGNHDDMPLETEEADGSYVRTPAKTSRAQLAANDERYRFSLTESGDTNLFGTSNYWLDVHCLGKVAARVLMLDSGGGTLEEEIAQNQIDWFWLHQDHYPADVPILAFQHIPSTADDFGYDADTCVGTNADSGVAPLSRDAGIVNALATAGNVKLLGVGHNHGNDYCCKNTDSLHLCFGRHSGYGGYSKVDRGVRVYRLALDIDSNYQGWSSYVRLETGEIIEQYDP